MLNGLRALKRRTTWRNDLLRESRSPSLVVRSSSPAQRHTPEAGCSTMPLPSLLKKTRPLRRAPNPFACAWWSYSHESVGLARSPSVAENGTFSPLLGQPLGNLGVRH